MVLIKSHQIPVVACRAADIAWHSPFRSAGQLPLLVTLPRSFDFVEKVTRVATIVRKVAGGKEESVFAV
ncbi:MAG TPA: hypothetical protein VH621_03865, partial [Nitrososphaera sp.]